jgi:hypothetical protein
LDGTPIIDPSLGFKNIDDSIYKRVELDRRGQIKNCESSSKEEFLVLKREN